MSSFQPEECPIDAVMHNKCSCEHCQQQALEKEFKDLLNLFFEVERLRGLYNITVTDAIRMAYQPDEALTCFLKKTIFEAERLHSLYNIAVTDEIRTACHRSEEALICFLQKTMTEEASRRYVSRMSATLEKEYEETTRKKMLEHAEQIGARRLEDEYVESLRSLYYTTYLLYPKTTAENISRPGIQKHYEHSRSCEERLMKCFQQKMSEEEAKERVSEIRDRIYEEEYKSNGKNAEWKV